MSGYIYIENPELSIVAELDDEMFRLNGWSRVQKAMEISYAGLEFFLIIVALEAETKKPVGIISVAKDSALDGNPDDDLFYVGSFYVSPEHRLKGIGKELGIRAMAHTQGKNAAMNGVLEMAEAYKVNGFPYYRDFKNAFTTIETGNVQLQSKPENLKIKNVREVDFQLIEEYDHGISRRNRGKYLHLWLTEPPVSSSKVSLDEDGKVNGLISINQQHTNRLIVGPFYADSVEIAQSLLHSALKDFDLSKFSRVIFKFPESNTGIRKILETITKEPFEIQANGLCMFTKKVLPVDSNRIFGLTETAHSFV